MKEFRIRSDLDRTVIGGYALPLGFTPGQLLPPKQGFSITYNAGDGEDPDTYTFLVAVSHERLAEVCERCFELLPDEVYAIVEIGSRDAYRAVDVYVGSEPIPREHFCSVWKYYEPFLLEDGSIAAGANAEEPFIEIFVDQRKTVVIHVPLTMRDDIEAALVELGLQEVPETWPDDGDIDDEDLPQIRPVLDVSDEYCPDVDELLLQLRQNWSLELNVDPDANSDEAGRELGLTLWHAVVIVSPLQAPPPPEPEGEGDGNGQGGYMSVWLTADSINRAETLIRTRLEEGNEWEFGVFYTIDRVAHDERPDELTDLPPRGSQPGVHLVSFEPWGEPLPEFDE